MALEQSNETRPARSSSRTRRRPPPSAPSVVEAAPPTAEPVCPATPAADQIAAASPDGDGVAAEQPARRLLPVPPMGSFTAYLAVRLQEDPPDDVELASLMRRRFLYERCAEFPGLPGREPSSK